MRFIHVVATSSLFIVGSGCSLTIPPTISKATLPVVTDPACQRALSQCVDRLNWEAQQARKQRDTSDTLAIVGGIISSATSVTSAALSAAGSSGDEAKTESIAAAVTAGIAALSSVIALAAKLNESPAVALQRRSRAEASFLLGQKELARGHAALAFEHFVDCAGAGGGESKSDAKTPDAGATNGK